MNSEKQNQVTGGGSISLANSPLKNYSAWRSRVIIRLKMLIYSSKLRVLTGLFLVSPALATFFNSLLMQELEKIIDHIQGLTGRKVICHNVLEVEAEWVLLRNGKEGELVGMWLSASFAGGGVFDNGRSAVLAEFAFLNIFEDFASSAYNPIRDPCEARHLDPIGSVGPSLDELSLIHI